MTAARTLIGLRVAKNNLKIAQSGPNSQRQSREKPPNLNHSQKLLLIFICLAFLTTPSTPRFWVFNHFSGLQSTPFLRSFTTLAEVGTEATLLAELPSCSTSKMDSLAKLQAKCEAISYSYARKRCNRNLHELFASCYSAMHSISTTKHSHVSETYSTSDLGKYHQKYSKSSTGSKNEHHYQEKTITKPDGTKEIHRTHYHYLPNGTIEQVEEVISLSRPKSKDPIDSGETVYEYLGSDGKIHRTTDKAKMEAETKGSVTQTVYQYIGPDGKTHETFSKAEAEKAAGITQSTDQTVYEYYDENGKLHRTTSKKEIEKLTGGQKLEEKVVYEYYGKDGKVHHTTSKAEMEKATQAEEQIIYEYVDAFGKTRRTTSKEEAERATKIVVTEIIYVYTDINGKVVRTTDKQKMMEAIDEGLKVSYEYLDETGNVVQTGKVDPSNYKFKPTKVSVERHRLTSQMEKEAKERKKAKKVDRKVKKGLKKTLKKGVVIKKKKVDTGIRLKDVKRKVVKKGSKTAKKKTGNTKKELKKAKKKLKKKKEVVGKTKQKKLKKKRKALKKKKISKKKKRPKKSKKTSSSKCSKKMRSKYKKALKRCKHLVKKLSDNGHSGKTQLKRLNICYKKVHKEYKQCRTTPQPKNFKKNKKCTKTKLKHYRTKRIACFKNHKGDRKSRLKCLKKLSQFYWYCFKSKKRARTPRCTPNLNKGYLKSKQSCFNQAALVKDASKKTVKKFIKKCLKKVRKRYWYCFISRISKKRLKRRRFNKKSKMYKFLIEKHKKAYLRRRKARLSKSEAKRIARISRVVRRGGSIATQRAYNLKSVNCLRKSFGAKKSTNARKIDLKKCIDKLNQNPKYKRCYQSYSSSYQSYRQTVYFKYWRLFKQARKNCLKHSEKVMNQKRRTKFKRRCLRMARIKDPYRVVIHQTDLDLELAYLQISEEEHKKKILKKIRKKAARKRKAKLRKKVLQIRLKNLKKKVEKNKIAIKREQELREAKKVKHAKKIKKMKKAIKKIKKRHEKKKAIRKLKKLKKLKKKEKRKLKKQKKEQKRKIKKLKKIRKAEKRRKKRVERRKKRRKRRKKRKIRKLKEKLLKAKKCPQPLMAVYKKKRRACIVKASKVKDKKLRKQTRTDCFKKLANLKKFKFCRKNQKKLKKRRKMRRQLRKIRRKKREKARKLRRIKKKLKKKKDIKKKKAKRRKKEAKKCPKNLKNEYKAKIAKCRKTFKNDKKGTSGCIDRIKAVKKYKFCFHTPKQKVREKAVCASRYQDYRKKIRACVVKAGAIDDKKERSLTRKKCIVAVRQNFKKCSIFWVNKYKLKKCKKPLRLEYERLKRICIVNSANSSSKKKAKIELKDCLKRLRSDKKFKNCWQKLSVRARKDLKADKTLSKKVEKKKKKKQKVAKKKFERKQRQIKRKEARKKRRLKRKQECPLAIKKSYNRLRRTCVVAASRLKDAKKRAADRKKCLEKLKKTPKYKDCDPEVRRKKRFIRRQKRRIRRKIREKARKIRRRKKKAKRKLKRRKRVAKKKKKLREKKIKKGLKKAAKKSQKKEKKKQKGAKKPKKKTNSKILKKKKNAGKKGKIGKKKLKGTGKCGFDIYRKYLILRNNCLKNAKKIKGKVNLRLKMKRRCYEKINRFTKFKGCHNKLLKRRAKEHKQSKKLLKKKVCSPKVRKLYNQEVKLCHQKSKSMLTPGMKSMSLRICLQNVNKKQIYKDCKNKAKIPKKSNSENKKKQKKTSGKTSKLNSKKSVKKRLQKELKTSKKTKKALKKVIRKRGKKVKRVLAKNRLDKHEARKLKKKLKKSTSPGKRKILRVKIKGLNKKVKRRARKMERTKEKSKKLKKIVNKIQKKSKKILKTVKKKAKKKVKKGAKKNKKANKKVKTAKKLKKSVKKKKRGSRSVKRIKRKLKRLKKSLKHQRKKQIKAKTEVSKNKGKSLKMLKSLENQTYKELIEEQSKVKTRLETITTELKEAKLSKKQRKKAKFEEKLLKEKLKKIKQKLIKSQNTRVKIGKEQAKHYKASKIGKIAKKIKKDKNKIKKAMKKEAKAKKREKKKLRRLLKNSKQPKRNTKSVKKKNRKSRKKTKKLHKSLETLEETALCTKLLYHTYLTKRLNCLAKFKKQKNLTKKFAEIRECHKKLENSKAFKPCLKVFSRLNKKKFKKFKKHKKLKIKILQKKPINHTKSVDYYIKRLKKYNKQVLESSQGGQCLNPNLSIKEYRRLTSVDLDCHRGFKIGFSQGKNIALVAINEPGMSYEQGWRMTQNLRVLMSRTASIYHQCALKGIKKGFDRIWRLKLAPEKIRKIEEYEGCIRCAEAHNRSLVNKMMRREA